MAGFIFKSLFKTDPKQFKSVHEVDQFFETKTGSALPVLLNHTGVASCRGSIFTRTRISASAIFDKALSKK